MTSILATSQSTNVAFYRDNVKENDLSKQNQAKKNELFSSLQLIDENLNEITAEKDNPTLMTMIASQQKQVTLAMLGQFSGTDTDIELSLLSSIDIYTARLEQIDSNSGGKGAFDDYLIKMFDNLNKSKLSGSAYEDMFQLALLDALSNTEQYGITDSELTTIGNLLEKTGTGGHNTWDFSPGKMEKEASEIFNKILQGIKSGKIPQDSTAYKAIASIGNGKVPTSIPAKFLQQYKDKTYDDPNAGGWITSSYKTMNPMHRIVLLSKTLAEYSLTSEQINSYLIGSVSDLDSLTKDVTKGKFQSVIDHFLESDVWQDSHAGKLPDGVTIALDYEGTIEQKYLIDLYTEYPRRSLTTDELEEINRIGDQVKMIQQTLKYWIQLCSDGQLAISRNI